MLGRDYEAKESGLSRKDLLSFMAFQPKQTKRSCKGSKILQTLMNSYYRGLDDGSSLFVSLYVC